MKKDFHFHFYSRVVIALLILALGVFFLQRSVETEAITVDDIDIGGWAWNEDVGWLSLNCDNDWDGDGINNDACASGGGFDWGLQVVNGNVRGCAWYGNYSGGSEDNSAGWVCFDDQGSPSISAPANGIKIVTDETAATNINGLCVANQPTCSSGNSYASMVEFEDELDSDAWQLRFNIEDPIAPLSSINGCFNCYVVETKQCAEGGNSCDDDTDCTEEGDSCVVVSTENRCNNCLEYDYHSDARCTLDPNETCPDDAYCQGLGLGTCEEGLLDRVVGAYQCTGCTFSNINNTCDLNSQSNNLNSCTSCDAYYETPGVMIDNRNNEMTSPERARMCGWAWNAWNDGTADYGIGWIQFSPRVTTTSYPYISVERGSIYSKGNIFGRYLPPFGRYNASYLIEAGGSITNFISSSTIDQTFEGNLSNRPEIDFLQRYSPAPGPGFQYTNVLGTVDVSGLMTEQKQNSMGQSINKYGSVVITDPANFANEFTSPLNGKVIVVNNQNLEINSALEILGNSGTRSSGIVIVNNGDLVFNADVTYRSQATIGNLREIPNIVWIVIGDPSNTTGDVRIDAAVSEIAGTIVVMGDSGKSCDPAAPLDGCGYIDTCYQGDCTTDSLTIYGSVIARAFLLNRLYSSPLGEASELFVNDGRLQANPPLGLTEFVKTVPRLSE